MEALFAGQYRLPGRTEHNGQIAISAEVCDNQNSIATGWGVYRLAEVRIQDGESIENALRRFKRKVQQEDIIKEVKKHSFYLKPGEKKRIKQALARKRSRKKVRREPVE
jgi:small subunit ribosomal protein S21